MTDREAKNGREVKDLLFKSIMVSIDEMDKFEQKNEENKAIKNTWYNWLIDYIPQPIRKTVGCFKEKMVSRFKTNIPKQAVYGRRKKLSKSKAQSIRNPFIIKKKKK